MYKINYRLMRNAQRNALSGCGCEDAGLSASFSPKRSLEQQFQALLDDANSVMPENPGGSKDGGTTDNGTTDATTEASMMPVLLGGSLVAGLLYLVSQQQ